MKDKTARALAIVALVFAAVFIAALIATLVDYTLLNNGVGFIALGAGVFVLMIFIALKADGRTYSITKMNNDIEMAKLEKEAAERAAAQAEKEKSDADNETNGDGAERSEKADDALSGADGEEHGDEKAADAHAPDQAEKSDG